ncbi:hypothetical protein [Persicobacter diffluens]|uniref:Arsenate reductase n=1 Tax=Persicobacter diffluens TaxID=981 RepID=A0AAN5ANY0_9BACT|nr:hypothetical protein PEDI_43280 [Persicobacter diffluens]
MQKGVDSPVVYYNGKNYGDREMVHQLEKEAVGLRHIDISLCKPGMDTFKNIAASWGKQLVDLVNVQSTFYPNFKKRLQDKEDLKVSTILKILHHHPSLIKTPLFVVEGSCYWLRSEKEREAMEKHKMAKSGILSTS